MTRMPDTPGQLWRVAIDAIKSGDRAVARAACERLVEREPRHRAALELLARIALEGGQPDAAGEWLLRALEVEPMNVKLLVNLALVSRQRGDASACLALLERAADVDPLHTSTVMNLALTLKEAGRDIEAVERLSRLLAGGSAPAAAHALQAQLLERLSRLAEAREQALAALAIDPAEPVALLVLADLDLRSGHPQQTLNSARTLADSAAAGPVNRALAHYLASQAHDRLEHWAEAFAAAERGNRILAEGYFSQHAGDEGPYALPAVEIMGQWLAGRPAAAHKAVSAKDSVINPPPVFLLGFPRSGTTLTEQILRRHPDVAAIEERDLVAPLVAPWLGSPAALDRLTDPEGMLRHEVRRRYLEHSRSEAGARDGQLVVDKLPLNSVFLPLITSLFPEARIILALRDPRDVCLSCFLQSFRLNAAMAQFLELDTTATYYVAVMSNVLDTLERLSPRMHPVRYESVVEDLETEARTLLGALDLPWRAEVTDYRAGLANRLVDTPSRSQVNRPLYRRSIGRWRHYAPSLRPVLPRLDPIAARLGYGSAGRDGQSAMPGEGD